MNMLVYKNRCWTRSATASKKRRLFRLGTRDRSISRASTFNGVCGVYRLRGSSRNVLCKALVKNVIWFGREKPSDSQTTNCRFKRVDNQERFAFPAWRENVTIPLPAGNGERLLLSPKVFWWFLWHLSFFFSVQKTFRIELENWCKEVALKPLYFRWDIDDFRLEKSWKRHLGTSCCDLGSSSCRCERRGFLDAGPRNLKIKIG